jgi:hypothetical protein
VETFTEDFGDKRVGDMVMGGLREPDGMRMEGPENLLGNER